MAGRSITATISSISAVYRPHCFDLNPVREIRVTERVMHPLQSLASLSLSVGALAFVVWIALAHPAHQSVYGPYAPAAHVAASHA
jgi:hypothetical protein